MSPPSAPPREAAPEARSPARPPAEAWIGQDVARIAHGAVDADVWQLRDAGLLRARYASDCVVHTPSGPLRGREALVQAAVDALATADGQTVIVEDMTREEIAPGRVNTSHRTTRCLNGTPVAQTLVDRRICDGLVKEEWRVCDVADGALRAGCDPFAQARAQAAADAHADPACHAWRSTWIAGVRERSVATPADGHPAAIPAEALRLALATDLFGRAAQSCAPAVETRWPGGRTGWGRDCWIGGLLRLRSLLHDVRLRLEGWSSHPLPLGEVAVSLRWSLAGVHAGGAAWGEPSGRDILVMAISQYRLRGAVILEDVTVFDETAVLRQIAGGLGAAPPADAGPATAVETRQGVCG